MENTQQPLPKPAQDEIAFVHDVLKDIDELPLAPDDPERIALEHEFEDFSGELTTDQAHELASRGLEVFAKRRHPAYLGTEVGISHLTDTDYQSSVEQEQPETIIDLRDSPDRVTDAPESLLPGGTVPTGYKSARLLKTERGKPIAKTLSYDQFDEISSLIPAIGQTELTANTVLELVTDGGHTVRLIDLRPFMTSQVKKMGPDRQKDSDSLSDDVLTAIKNNLDGTGKVQKVHGVHGVFYTAMSRTTMRAYWMDVKTEDNDGVRTMARLADGGSKPEERDLYRRVFRLRMSEKV